MNIQRIFEKYYQPGTPLYNSVWSHSKLVAEKALKLAQAHPELNIDSDFTGEEPYIRHGIIGAELLRNEGYPKHALVCERHTGTGLTVDDIISQNLPLPHRDMRPISLEEKLVCFADKFYSKSTPDQEKPFDKVRKSVAKYGDASLHRFDEMATLFL